MQQLGINQAEETTVVVASMPTGNYKNHLQSTDKRKVWKKSSSQNILQISSTVPTFWPQSKTCHVEHLALAIVGDANGHPFLFWNVGSRALRKTMERTFWADMIWQTQGSNEERRRNPHESNLATSDSTWLPPQQKDSPNHHMPPSPHHLVPGVMRNLTSQHNSKVI